MKFAALLLCLTLILGCGKNAPFSGARETKECGNLLSELAESPEHLEFLSCEHGNGQLIFKAKYRVSGKHAAAVEEFLRTRYGLGKLVFLCCGWEPVKGKSGVFRTPDLKNGIHYEISLYSEETLIKDRRRWNEIQYFYAIAKVWEI